MELMLRKQEHIVLIMVWISKTYLGVNYETKLASRRSLINWFWVTLDSISNHTTDSSAVKLLPWLTCHKVAA